MWKKKQNDTRNFEHWMANNPIDKQFIQAHANTDYFSVKIFQLLKSL